MWNNPAEDFIDFKIENHRTADELMNLEKEWLNGVTLQDCFNLFTKNEELDDYKCDKCGAVGKASAKI